MYLLFNYEYGSKVAINYDLVHEESAYNLL